MKSSFSPACFPVRVSHCLWVGCVKEHEPVNVYHTGEMLSFWLCNDYHPVLSHWCKWCTIIQWLKARYLQKKKKKLLLIIYCLKIEKKHFVVLLWLLRVFYLFLNGNCYRVLLCFQMVHFVGMPVMCSDVLQNSMHGVCSSIKTRNWYPVIKGYVVVFQTTPPLCSLGHAESTFS